MRIAVLSTLASGGAAIAAERITLALTAAGHDCSFFTVESSGKLRMISLADNAAHADSVFWVPALFRRWTTLTSPEALRDGGTELFSDQTIGLHAWNPFPKAIHEAEIIHLHWMAGMLFSPSLLAACRGKKIVWTLHDMNAISGGCHYHISCRQFETGCSLCPLLRDSGPDDASARCFRLKQALYSVLAPTIVTPSEWLAAEVQTSALLGQRSLYTIPNCIDTTVFRPGGREEFRRRLGIAADTFVIIVGAEYLGNPRKNTRMISEALELLARRGDAMCIEILTFGGGEFPHAAFPVHALGHLEDDAALAEAYSAADILVHTTLQDNLPNTLCEAQCCGTPILAFDVGGCAEAMLPGETGFIVKEKTVEALAGILQNIYDRRMELAPMREAARIFAVERFDPGKTAAVYTEVFANTPPSPSLTMDSNLFMELASNQIASLAALFRDVQEEQERRFVEMEQYVTSLNDRIASVESHLAQWRQNLRHPLRYLFRKLRNRSQR
jgi:Glycosyltransferase